MTLDIPATPLYPPIEPFDVGFLRVSSLHEIYYEQSGNPQGRPVVFLHGGPGSCTSSNHRRFFDPQHYRIVLLDQRGAGKSRPHASLEDNTTWHLVSDLERLREHLGIRKWIAFGGSWGSTLALTYAQTHPSRFAGLILRGVFLCEQWELDWMYKEGGASAVFPDAWDEFISIVPLADRKRNMIDVFGPYLTHPDQQIRQKFAQVWTRWEASVIQLIPDLSKVDHMEEDQFALSFARIENHFFSNRGFFPEPNYLINHVDQLTGIPGIIVHGRYDMVCPLQSSWKLHKAWPGSTLHIVPNAGHTMKEPGIELQLVRAADAFRSLVF